MNYLMLSCKKAAFLIDKKAETKLSWKENIQLNIHTSMCDACNTYKKQSKLIDVFLKHKHNSNQNETIDIIPNDGLKSKIIKNL